jgi:hypothetical protein
LLNPSNPMVTVSVRGDTVGIADSGRLVADIVVGGTARTGYQLTWSSSDPAVAAVDSQGRVRGLVRGSATITAELARTPFTATPVRGTGTVRVVVPRLAIAPTDTILTSVGDTVCFRPIPLDARKDTLSLAADSLRPDSAFAPAGGTGQKRCFAALRATGAVSVRAWLDTVRATTTVIVRPVAARFLVTPDSVRFNSLTAQRQLAATAFDRRNNPIAAPAITWTNPNPAVAAASGTGLITANGDGTAFVRAQSDTIRDSVKVVVQQVAESIAISPAIDTVRTVRGRATLAATLTDSLGKPISAATPAWTSLAPDSVHIVTYAGSSATVEALAEGSATIVAQDSVAGRVLTGAARVTVHYQLKSLTVAPAAPTLSALGDTVRFTATGRDMNDSLVAQPHVVWRTSNGSKVAIDSLTGLATARDSGQTGVTAQHDATTGAATATVAPPWLIVVPTAAFIDSGRRSSSDSPSVIRTIIDSATVGTVPLGARLAIVHGASWLSVAPDTVTVPARTSTSVRITAGVGTLVEGTYRDTVRIRSVGAVGSPRDIPVQFRVYCVPVSIAPDTTLAASIATTDCMARHQAGSFADYYVFSGNAGDTIRITMSTGSQSYTYLYLLDGTGALVPTNTCAPQGFNSCLQVALPATGTYTIEATTFYAAQTFAYTLSLTHPQPPTAATGLGQFAPDGSTIVAGGSTGTSSLLFRATGHDANSGDTLRLQVEVQPFGTPFQNNPSPTSTASPAPNASGGVMLSATVTNLSNGSYHWQARTADQTGRLGPWTAFGAGVSADFIVNITNSILTVTPTAVRDSALAGSTAPRQQSVQIANTGTGMLNWSAVKDSAWIGLSASSGSAPPPATLTISLDPTGKAAGTYQGTVTVTAAGVAGSPAQIAVTFVIQQPPAPVLVVTPAAISHATNVGTATFNDTLRIANGGTGSLSWTAAKAQNQSWLTLAKVAGGAPDQIPLTIASSGLTAGTHADTIVVTASGASGSPARIPVTLTVSQPLLAVSPTSVQDSASVSSSVQHTATLQITNAGSGTLSWTATKTAPWVTLSKSSGGAPDSVAVTLSPAGLAAGTQRDTIVFAWPEDNNSPVKVPVRFDILQPVLSVAPATLADSAIQGDTTSRVKTLTVANTGRGSLAWSAARDSAWITLSPASAPAPGTLTVTLHPGGQPVGTYTGKVVVTSANATGSPVTIPVTLTIKPPPILSVSPTTYSDSAFQGSTLPHAFSLRINNTGPGALTWTATKDTTWLTLSKAAGGAPPLDSTVVTLTPGSLLVATHTGTVTVTAPGAAGSPASVPISFKIKPCGATTVTADTVISDVIRRSDCGAPQRAGSLAKLYSVQAIAGDTLTLRLSAAFTPYLVLTDSFGVSLAQNGSCPGLATTACIVNFGVQQPGRYVVEATTSVAGDTGTFSLSVVKPKPPTAPTGIGQFLKDATTAIAVGAITHEDSVVFKGTINDPNPRDSVRLEIEARVLGTAFMQAATHQSAFVPVTPGGRTVAIRGGGLVENAGYHWQARTCDNTGRCSAWLSFGGNLESAADFYFDAVLEPPAAPTGLAQYQSDGTTAIATGGHTGGLIASSVTVVLKANVTDPDPGALITLTVQVTGGGNTYTFAGSAVPSGSVASVTASNLPTGLLAITPISYTWKAQACQGTQCSAFVSHGGSPDFLAP